MFEIVFGKADEVGRAVAERGHLDGNDVEPKIEVFAERAISDAFFKIAAGGGDDAHLGLARDIFAEPLVFTFLEQT